MTETRSALQELTTNASRNPAAAKADVHQDVKQSQCPELAASGPSFQNDSSLFKSSGLQPLMQHQQQQSHFITFKPASAHQCENLPTSQGESPVRNPFPAKFRRAEPQAMQLPGAAKTLAAPTRLEDVNFDDTIKKESECYKLPAAATANVEATPQVLSQYSAKTSPATRQQPSDDLESVVGA